MSRFIKNITVGKKGLISFTDPGLTEGSEVSITVENTNLSHRRLYGSHPLYDSEIEPLLREVWDMIKIKTAHKKEKSYFDLPYIPYYKKNDKLNTNPRILYVG